MKKAAYCVLIVLFSVAPLFAEKPAELRGVVTDSSGAALAEATVSVIGSDGFRASGGSDDDGRYEVQGLAPGKYVVRITMDGFAPFEARDVELPAGRPVTLRARLTITKTATINDAK